MTRFVFQVTTFGRPLPIKRVIEADTSIETLQRGLLDPEVARALKGHCGNLVVSVMLPHREPEGAEQPQRQPAVEELTLKVA